MNNLVITGRLTTDGTYAKRMVDGIEFAVYNNTVAVNTRKSDGSEKTDFFDFGIWRGLADVCREKCYKGQKVALHGSVGLKTYINQYNQMVPRLQVHTVKEIEFLEKKEGAQEQSVVEPEETAPAPVVEEPAVTADDDELPF